jgi:hypothetical protein
MFVQKANKSKGKIMTCQDDLIELEKQLENLKRRKAEITSNSILRIRNSQTLRIVREMVSDLLCCLFWIDCIHVT